ncbi:hypothetical protein JCGZ_26428 [Jatropha curcas]|uniref:Uncharacterized protein n=1 Tax=Jatropha curcas TaxID=180498 RepID=A0A067JFI1_JATCU|nr:hypothetical protein JCGZ_26428 [Jatropha curcas]
MERASKEEQNLKQQYKHLQQEWDSIKNSKPRTLRRSATDSRTILKGLKLFDNSPRKLMSSLQHTRSSLDNGEWKVRDNDLAVVEILRERRAAIQSGKLKGRRRLFNDAEEGDFVEETEMRSIFSYDSDNENQSVQNNQLCPLYASYSPLSSTSSSSYVCDDCMEKEMVAHEGENKMEKEPAITKQEEKRSDVKGITRIIILLVFLIGIISFAMRSFSGYGYRNEMVLVPT